MKKRAGYHIMFGELEKHERRRKKEQDKFWRDQKREWEKREKEKIRKSTRVKRGVSDSALDYSHTGSNYISNNSTEEKVIEVIVAIFFLIVGFSAIVIPFIFDFWIIFKIIFVCGGLFSISIGLINEKR